MSKRNPRTLRTYIVAERLDTRRILRNFPAGLYCAAGVSTPPLIVSLVALHVRTVSHMIRKAYRYIFWT